MQGPDKRSWLVPATVSLALIPTAAGASGFALLEQSASRLGTAFAGTAAAADDATTVFFNPAGMTALSQSEAVVRASGIDISSQFRNDSSIPAFAQPLGGNGGDAGAWNFVPAAYFAMPAGDDLAFGIGVNAPFGLKLVYDDDWIGRFQALRSEISTLNINPSVAYKIGERFSIGAGVNAIGALWQPSASLLMDFGCAHLLSDTVPLNQDAGNVAASALLNGNQHSDIDIVSAQLVYRF